MSVSIADETWKQRFSTISNEAMEIFGASFFDRFGQRKWHPTDSDRIAAHKFHVELISRVATQSLGYSGGVERRALTSVFELFARARSLTQEESNCETFEIVVWYVLNTYVRPFTAKWHVRSETGELDALDGSDIFRAELQVIQKSLVALDGVLNAICNRNGIAASVEDSPIRQAIRSEMARLVGWRPMGEVIDEEQSDLSREEQERVDGRRQFYKVEQRKWAAGLALSGGGIRSATFSIGVMVALSKRGLLPQFDYLSTVSGGGYAGSFLTQLLGTAGSTGGLSLRATDLPFLRREGESELLQRIRHGASYLTSSAWERFVLTMAQAQGIFLTFVVVLSIVSVVAFGDYILRSQISSLIWREVALFSSIALVGLFLAVPLIRGWSGKSLAGESSWIPLLGALFLIPPVWVGLDGTHRLFDLLLTAINTNGPAGIAQLVILWTVVGSFLIVSGAAFARIGLARPIALSAISILALITAEATAYKMFQIVGFGTAAWFVVSLTLIAITLWAFLDINATSLHGFYRTKLAQAFLVDDKCLSAPPIKLSAIDSSRTLFPILSCALNVPGSADPKMRGRHADVTCTPDCPRL